MSRPDLAPIIALVGERPGVALASAVSNASSDSFSGVIPAYSAALGVTPELAAVVQDVAFAVMYRQAMTLTAEEALALAVSPNGIAFLQAAVAEYQGSLERRPLPLPQPAAGREEDTMKERRTGAALDSFIAIVGESLSPALVESIGESAARAGAGRCPAFADALGVSEQLGEVLRHVAAAVLHRRALTLSVEEAVRVATSPEGIAFLTAAVADFHEQQDLGRSRRRTS